MKKITCFRSATGMALVLALSSATAFAGSSKDSPAKAAARPLNLRSVPEVPIPQSVFVIPSQPSEGRNPFFPESTIKVIVPRLNKENPIDTTSIVLNGITSPPKRLAMINGRTFAAGEEGEVKLPSGGKMLIKCEEIKSESAIILVAGQRREIKLRSGV